MPSQSELLMNETNQPKRGRPTNEEAAAKR